MLRNAVMWWSGLLLAGLSAPVVASAGVSSPTQASVEQAVIAAIPAWHGKKATVLKYLDLTQPFDTVSPWALVVARDPAPPTDDLAMMGNDSPIDVCWVKDRAAKCSEGRGYTNNNSLGTTNSLAAAAVVFAGPGQTQPLVILQAMSAHGMNGNASIGTTLFKYDNKIDGFREVFGNINNGGTNNNAATRFVEHGPLQGDVIVDYPTGDAPYAYWIEVYAPGRSGQYACILRYRSITRYGDGNPLPVADSDMPEIMKRLGVWKPGDAPPIPLHVPEACGPLVVHHGEEWCKTGRIARSPQ